MATVDSVRRAQCTPSFNFALGASSVHRCAGKGCVLVKGHREGRAGPPSPEAAVAAAAAAARAARRGRKAADLAQVRA